jgi:hypothetical protein
MKNSTNILLLIVIILLVALLVDRRGDNNKAFAEGGGAINNTIFATGPSGKESFWLVNTEGKNLLYYEYIQGTKSILLKASRQYDYDFKVLGSYVVKDAQGDTYSTVKTFVEKQK